MEVHGGQKIEGKIRPVIGVWSEEYAGQGGWEKHRAETR